MPMPLDAAALGGGAAAIAEVAPSGAEACMMPAATPPSF
jgi:hypothetical protein